MSWRLVILSARDRADVDPLLTLEAGMWAVRLYSGGYDPCEPRASHRFGNLADLPPVLLHVGEDEILLDDSRRYANLTEAVVANCTARSGCRGGRCRRFVLANLPLNDCACSQCDWVARQAAFNVEQCWLKIASCV
jgi:hypothetical protein